MVSDKFPRASRVHVPGYELWLEVESEVPGSSVLCEEDTRTVAIGTRHTTT
jgi:hypothetical protein